MQERTQNIRDAGKGLIRVTVQDTEATQHKNVPYIKMVEQHVITHLRDGLVNGLPCGPDCHSAEYISSANQVRLLAEAGDRFSQAARAIRFRLVYKCWM